MRKRYATSNVAPPLARAAQRCGVIVGFDEAAATVDLKPVENYVGSRLVWPNNVGDVEEHALLRTIVTVAFSELLRPGISS